MAHVLLEQSPNSDLVFFLALVLGMTGEKLLTRGTELYTDESPGLKVDPVVVLVLSVVFIISVVALHGKRPNASTPYSMHRY